MTVFGSLQSLVALLLITLSPLLLSSTTSAFPIITDVDESYTKVSSSRGWCASQLGVGIADVGLDIRTPIVDPNDLDTYPISSLSHRAVLQLQRP